MAPNDAPCRDRRLRHVIQHIIQDLTRQPEWRNWPALQVLSERIFVGTFIGRLGSDSPFGAGMCALSEQRNCLRTPISQSRRSPPQSATSM